MKYTFLTLLTIIVFGSCRQKPEEVSIFSIPENATPVELEHNGFMVDRYKMNGKVCIGSCFLDQGFAQVGVSYNSNDTTKIRKYIIRVDAKPFRKLTGIKAKEYSNVEIEGVHYNIQQNGTTGTLYLKRLGL